MDSRPPAHRTPAEATRDAGLRRASTLTKWVAVGAITSIGALAGFVAQAKPGHSTTPSASGGGGSTAPSPSSSSPAAANRGGEASAGGSLSVDPTPTLAPPATAPAPTPSPPAVVS